MSRKMIRGLGYFVIEILLETEDFDNRHLHSASRGKDCKAYRGKGLAEVRAPECSDPGTQMIQWRKATPL